MAHRVKQPLIDADGEARTPTKEEWNWAVNATDFPNFMTAAKFVDERALFLHAAEQAGIARETFLPFAPNKPGFIERATAALESAARAGRHAAE
jgi:hypothetical protein